MAKKNLIKGIRKDASEANKEFYSEVYNLSQVCKYFKETTKYEINPATGRPVKVEISRPKRDYFLSKVSKYLTVEQITPKFCVENCPDVVEGKIMKRTRVETEESTEENKKYKFVLSDVERTQFSPSFVANCIITYANKQAALIATNSGANKPAETVKPVEQQGEANDAIKANEKQVNQLEKKIERNKRSNNEKKQLAEAS